MPILEQDIKILASQVLADVPEGGGAATGTEIVDGASNNLFPDISELNRVYGAVHMRKTFVGVRTADTDGYYGAHMIVADAPDDPDVSCLLFDTDDSFDVRTAAASRVEAYLAQGASWQGLLFGNHIAGQMSVTIIQRESVAQPVIGDTLVLRKNEGLSTQFEQYVRVTDVSSTLSTFSDGSSAQDFTRNVVVCSISDQLEQDFNGFDAVRNDASINYTGKTKLYSTVVADAARYYGITPMSAAASLGDFSVEVEDIFSQLVPTGQQETGIADARMNQQTQPMVAAGDTISQNVTLAWTTSQQMFVGGGILPGSLSITRSAVTVTDKGGRLIQADGSQVGQVDYANGVLTLSTNVFGTAGGTHAVSYKPATAATVVTESVSLPVTQEGQRTTYVATLNPIPARGTLQVNYRAQGRWYVLTDDGSGAITGGDSSLGAGTLNYTTGTVSLTLGALPDVGSRLIFAFAGSTATQPVSTQTVVSGYSNRFHKVVELGKAVKPGTLVITWNDGAARTATDDPNTGTLTGDATGTVRYAAGTVTFSPNTLPAKGTVITFALTESVQDTDVGTTFTDGGSTWTGTLGPVRAGTVEIAVGVTFPLRVFPGEDTTNATTARVFDDGAGVLKVTGLTGSISVGTINYSTGAFSINKTTSGFTSSQSVWSKVTPFGGAEGQSTYVKLTGSETRTTALTVTAVQPSAAPVWAWWSDTATPAWRARFGTSDNTVPSQTVPLNDVFLFGSNGAIYLGGRNGVSRYTAFYLGSDYYTISSWFSGEVFKNPLPNGSAQGTLVGSVGEVNGRSGLVLTDWTAGTTSEATTVRGTVVGEASGETTYQLVDSATFRTAVAPLKNGGFSVVGTFKDGTTFNATADSSGNIVSGTAVSGSTPGSYGVFGKVDYQYGVVELRFGRRVPVSMSGQAGVIDLSGLGLAGVSLVQSQGVQSDTLRYNASAFTYTPLDPEILGLNPVRLPSDGRVPIFRAGTVAVVHHTATTTAAVVSNGQTINCGRTRLARVRVLGANDATITSGYTANLDAGTVTFTNVTGYSQPVRIEHRIEDTALVADAQITGLLRLNRPLTHDFPVGSFVSSALLIGDMAARTSKVFDQATWSASSPVWSDDLIGSTAGATYDVINYPIEVTNESAVTERWVLVFTGSTSFNIYGEHLGLIGAGTTSADCAPLNPNTGNPYFRARLQGFGAGWAAGNAIRINTVGALAPVWVARVIKQGAPTVTGDSFTLLVRGDVDTP